MTEFLGIFAMNTYWSDDALFLSIFIEAAPFSSVLTESVSQTKSKSISMHTLAFST